MKIYLAAMITGAIVWPISLVQAKQTYPELLCAFQNQKFERFCLKYFRKPECNHARRLFAAICFLESSGKWPQDVDALQRMKAAFHVAFAEELEHSYRDLICVPSFSFVDIYKVIVENISGRVSFFYV